MCLMAWQGAIDIFCLAHALGWFGKAMILRDYWFCWVRPNVHRQKISRLQPSIDPEYCL